MLQEPTRRVAGVLLYTNILIAHRRRVHEVVFILLCRIHVVWGHEILVLVVHRMGLLLLGIHGGASRSWTIVYVNGRVGTRRMRERKDEAGEIWREKE